MPDFKKLFEEILRRKPELTVEALSKLIEEKKRSVGSGYLTDSGAAFLVAADLGVSLERVATADLTLKDLYIGANEITIVARVFTVYPTRVYVRRDGSQGRYRRIILFDKDSFVKLTLWDDKSELVEKLQITIDSIVRVVKGYVKAGLDGKPVLNLGFRGGLELVEDQEAASKLPSIADMSRDVGSVNRAEANLSVIGLLKSTPRVSEFERGDGSKGRVTQLYLTSSTGERDIRVAIWSSEAEPFLNLPLNSTVRLVNVNAKLQPHGDIELHGDESTAVMILPPQEVYGPPASSEKKVSAFRLLTIGVSREDSEGKPTASALIVDSSSNMFTLILKDEAYRSLEAVAPNTIIECKPRLISVSTYICETPVTVKEKESDSSLPDTSTYTCKLNSAKALSTPIFVEAIALSRPAFQDITTKDGSTVKKGEVVVGDETGEARVVAWRRLADLLEDITPGQRLRLRGVIPQVGQDGSITLQVKSYSSIERVR